MRKTKLTMISLIVLLGISACTVPVAEYCDVAQGPVQFDNPASVSSLLANGERPALVQIDANNRTGERLCGWVVL